MQRSNLNGEACSLDQPAQHYRSCWNDGADRQATGRGLNLEIVAAQRATLKGLAEGDRVEIGQAIGGRLAPLETLMTDTEFGRTFEFAAVRYRLARCWWVPGKYKDMDETAPHRSSGAEIVRRDPPQQHGQNPTANLLDVIPPDVTHPANTLVAIYRRDALALPPGARTLRGFGQHSCDQSLEVRIGPTRKSLIPAT